eukprot:TRINITY_DN46188_c0_g1_i1.p1 TRINITY_DN46188_c0_g1~~TRINITY_DN46188_c0_g1_i1.p1  ORF type:complete len:495 (-),score=31.25 TRINITY_DN46188_c0_g1_i1:886-2370(-)
MTSPWREEVLASLRWLVSYSNCWSTVWSLVGQVVLAMLFWKSCQLAERLNPVLPRPAWRLPTCWSFPCPLMAGRVTSRHRFGKWWPASFVVRWVLLFWMCFGLAGAPAAGRRATSVPVDAQELLSQIQDNRESVPGTRYMMSRLTSRSDRHVNLVSKRALNRCGAQLGTDTLKPSTAYRYDLQLRRFENFLEKVGGVSLRFLCRLNAMQALIIYSLQFLQLGYDSGELALADAGNFVSALKKYLTSAVVSQAAPLLDIRSTLAPLWDAFKHWKSLEPYELRMPLPEFVWRGLLGRCLITREWDLFTFLLISFECLLRPGEALALKWGDISLLDSDGACGVVRIGEPKIKSPPAQHVLIESVWIAEVLKYLQQAFGHDKSAKIVQCSSYVFHKKFRQLLSSLHLHHPFSTDVHAVERTFTLAGLRAGGATAHYLKHQDLPRLQWKGRWKQVQVLKHYIQLGAYFMSGLQFPSSVSQSLASYSDELQAFLRGLDIF